MTIKELMKASKDELLVEQSKYISVLEKALGLACEELSDMLIECTKSSLIEDFKNKAREMKDESKS